MSEETAPTPDAPTGQGGALNDPIPVTSIDPLMERAFLGYLCAVSEARLIDHQGEKKAHTDAAYALFEDVMLKLHEAHGVKFAGVEIRAAIHFGSGKVMLQNKVTRERLASEGGGLILPGDAAFRPSMPHLPPNGSSHGA